MATPNRTLNTSVRITPKIQRTGDPHQLTIGPVPAKRKRPAICDWADLLYEFGVDAACQGVALQLVRYADRHGGCFPSIETLAERVQLKKRQCRRHLKTLARKGLIVPKRHGRGACNSYRLNGYGWGDDRPATNQEGSCTTPQEGSCTTPEGNHKKEYGSELRASAPDSSTVRTKIDGTRARPLNGAGEPLPEPSRERIQAAKEMFKVADKAFELSLVDGTASELRARMEATAPALKSSGEGCPQCGHDRLIGGSCDQCGHNIGIGFRMSPDWNMGGD